MNQDTPRGDWGRHSTSSGGLIRCPFPKGPSAQGHSVASRRQLAPSVSLYSQGADGTAERRGPMQTGWIGAHGLEVCPGSLPRSCFPGMSLLSETAGEAAGSLEPSHSQAGPVRLSSRSLMPENGGGSLAHSEHTQTSQPCQAHATGPLHLLSRAHCDPSSSLLSPQD